MGFTPARKVYTLDFSGTDLDGLEVKARSVSTGSFLQFSTLADAVKADMGSVRELFTLFADESLRSWNLEDDDGVPIPATLAGLLTQEFGFVFAIINAWMSIMTGVDADLKEESTSGTPSLAELPMTVPSSVSQVS